MPSRLTVWFVHLRVISSLENWSNSPIYKNIIMGGFHWSAQVSAKPRRYHRPSSRVRHGVSLLARIERSSTRLYIRTPCQIQTCKGHLQELFLVSIRNYDGYPIKLTRATPPATIMPRADPEILLTLAAPVAKAIGLWVAVGAMTAPVDATVEAAKPVDAQA